MTLQEFKPAFRPVDRERETTGEGRPAEPQLSAGAERFEEMPFGEDPDVPDRVALGAARSQSGEG